MTTKADDLPVSMSWTKFSWGDWAEDMALRTCSLAAQGLWMRLLCIAASETPYGHVTLNHRPASDRQIAALAGLPLNEASALVAELEESGVFSRTGSRLRDHSLEDMYASLTETGVFGEVDEGTIYSRRMIRDLYTYRQDIRNGKKGGNPNLRRAKLAVVQADNVTLHPRHMAVVEGGLSRPVATPDNPEVKSEANPKVMPDPNPEVNQDVKGGVNPPLNGGDKAKTLDSKSTEASLQGADAPAQRIAEGQSGFLPGFETPHPDPEPTSPPATRQEETVPVWSEGLGILADVLGRPAQKARPLLGKMRQSVRNDDVRLLSVLLRCKEERPANPESWIFDRLKERAKIVVDNDPNDSWGIQAWCVASKFSPTTHKMDQQFGKWLAPDGRFVIDRVAADVAETARLPRSWRGDWNVLLEWLNAGLKPVDHIYPAISRIAGIPSYAPPVHLRNFTKSVMVRKADAA